MIIAPNRRSFTSESSRRIADHGASDVIVIGGGITGCATAYHLALLGLSVRLFERGRLAAEQSSRAWGLVRQQGRHPAEIPLVAEALARWPRLARELGTETGFRASGILVTAESADDERRLVEAERVARDHGVVSRLVDGTEIARLLPDARRRWKCGLYTREDGQVEPEQASLAFAAAARERGVAIHECTPVVRIEAVNGVVRSVATAAGRFRAGRVLCAAGIGAGDVLRSAGVSLPIETVRSSVGCTGPARPASPLPAWTPRVAFRPRFDGSYIFSNGYRSLDSEYDISLRSLRHARVFLPAFLRQRSTLKLRLARESLRALTRELKPGGVYSAPEEPIVNRTWIRHNFAELCDVFPHLREVGIAGMWGGRIDVTPDLIPILGPVKAVDGLCIAAGFSAHGLALAPTVGRLLAEGLHSGRWSPALQPFRPERFLEGTALPSEDALV